ncbi:hypothetical protein [Rhodopirellula europaea]|uniref:Uncharacterized protein n=1 Tax=Rhodopirellula europaea SH398 TaxID=1263868 RepID=M5S7J3_9BACT|nr:hypothetical protein [Rhodopirellula europaea]EMI27426.1 hypothetical protein RESH_01828 [Rhodopirellula europaea SH398]
MNRFLGVRHFIRRLSVIDQADRPSLKRRPSALDRVDWHPAIAPVYTGIGHGKMD